ncbi:nitrogenase iron-molybdenum cofactor biosynthesis protein NifE [Thiobaca trueperi]|uniref:Nitrogenase iron-molybdenum cofactor biosynthesis protein NifE n=1 Tax=Thiobaca trueperi TaxID=127458 RepID=A0A4R3N780_9GAMM|nr:nitrogenase iron-molybdenum cofactor biosynthesis protein NifE [Thiobaca trueperi]TCT24271.1 nitrogenase molybdenum-cofactor synthesis protein NifE [Thiobaca trueperi]
MNASEITALQDEPACAHNHKNKSGCARAKPGATQGGCAFDGARNALVPIADAAHLVHGPIGCAGSSWDNRGSRSSGARLFRVGMTTDLSELDVIMGRGEKRLFFAIRQAIETHRPAAVFVYTTCVPALNGDDVPAVARAATERWGVPVIPVDCAGFYGNKNLGNRIAGDVLLKHVIGTREPDSAPVSARRPGLRIHDINLIGEWNVGGEFWNVAPLFDELGLRILCTLSGDARFREIQTMHRAEASMVVCSKAMLAVARHLQQDHGTPFFEGSFYGVQETSEALRGFARLLDDPDLSRRTEALIAREEARIREQLAPLRQRLAGKRAFIFTGGYKSWSIVSAMQDLGMEVVATGTEKSTEEDKARILTLMGPEARMIADNDQLALLSAFHECRADIMVAGDRYIYPTLKSRLPFLDIDHVRHVGYAGYRGMLELARNLVIAIHNPVWRQVRDLPPWLTAPRPTKVIAMPPRPVPALVQSSKPLSVNPLKVSQPVGASLPFLGIARAMPLEHGGRGCTSFNKLFFMRHFNEPIPLQTTAMDQVVTVMGADDNVVEALQTICETNRPEVIGLITTGLSETQGADIPRTIKAFRQTHPQYAETAVVPVSASDALGCLETGFAQAVEAIVRHLVPDDPHGKVRCLRQVNVLVGSMITPGDIEAIKEWIGAFGLHAVVVPDIGDSLDGHLIDEGYSTLTYGGVSRQQIAGLGESAATLVIGASLNRAADLLKARTGVPDHRFDSLMGLDACDDFTQILAQIANTAVPQIIERQRSQLLDAMVDCQFQLGGARMAVAADPDLLGAFSRFFADLGMETVAAVTTARSDLLEQLPLGQIIIGDLEDAEHQARQGEAQVLVTNSHGVDIAGRLGVQLLRAGFPIYDQAGAHLRQWVGYRGSRQTVFELANLLAAQYRLIPPYRSIYWQGTPRECETLGALTN